MPDANKDREEFTMCAMELRKHITSLPIKSSYSLKVAMEAVIRIAREHGLLEVTA